MRTKIVAALAVSLALVAAPRLALAQGKGSGGGKEKPPDEVTLKSGDTKKGEIVKETPRECHLKIGDKTQKLDWKEITNVAYGVISQEQACPQSVTTIENYVAKRNFGSAEREGDGAISDCQGSDRLKNLFLPRAKLAVARAKSRLGKYADAAKLCEEILADSAESRYAPEAWVERVTALSQAADESVEKVAKDAQDKAGDDFIMSNGAPAIEPLDLAFALYYEKKGKTLEAKTIYAKYEGSERPAIRERAKLGRARIAVLEKQIDYAKGIFQQLASSAGDPDAIAGALVGLGDAAMIEAEAAAAKDKPTALRQAFVVYLRAVVLAAPTGEGPSENHENSLRQAGRCAEKILATLPVGKPDTKEERARKFYADYARRIYEELIRSYPTAKDLQELREKAQKLRQVDQPAAPKPDEKKDEGKK